MSAQLGPACWPCLSHSSTCLDRPNGRLGMRRPDHNRQAKIDWAGPRRATAQLSTLACELRYCTSAQVSPHSQVTTWTVLSGFPPSAPTDPPVLSAPVRLVALVAMLTLGACTPAAVPVAAPETSAPPATET